MKLIFILLLAIPLSLQASEKRHTAIPIAGPQGDPGLNGNDGKDADAVAIGLAAAQIHPDFNYNGFQGGVGVATFDGEQAVVFGIARKACINRCGKKMLLNGSVGVSGGEVGAGVGANWRW